MSSECFINHHQTCHATTSNNALIYIFFILQEEIKITSVTVFVNPYTELDEEEEQDNAKEKNAEDEDNVCSIIFIPLTGCFLTSIWFC